MRSALAILPAALLGLSLVNCSGPPSGSSVLTAEMPLHLEEHLDEATIIGSEVPANLVQPVEWRFDEPQPGWKTTTPRRFRAGIRPPTVSQTHDALQITVGDLSDGRGRLVGSAYVDVPEWNHRDLAHVVIRARTSGPGELELGFNVLSQEGPPNEGRPFPFADWGKQVDTPLVGDSTVQTYQLEMEPSGSWEQPIEEFGLWFAAYQPLTVEILSITVVPVDALYAEEPAGMRHVERDGRYRRSLFVHTPAQLEYRVRVPDEGRLDTGLGTLWSEPTTFRVTVRADGEPAETLLEARHGDRETWAEHSVDLSAYAGQVVTLSLEAESEREGSVALWGAPTLTGPRTTDKPNVILYIIDAGGADYMSAYGYNRPTTPNLERLAAEGALFENAYSNSTWTAPSTASFMTSLQHSVLGGSRNGLNTVPEEAVTMAEHMHRAGYQTAVATHPNAGVLSDLQLNVDHFRETWPTLQSSGVMHDDYWRWRDAYPGEPYWIHIQTHDVAGHDPPDPVAPFAGLFISPERRAGYRAWVRQLNDADPGWLQLGPYSPVFEATGISRMAYYDARRSLYDENMAYNDYQLGQLVERLKAQGEWDRTLLIVAADHGSHSQQGLGLFDPLPLRQSKPTGAPRHGWRPIFGLMARVPLVVVWPGRIAPGQRFSEAVSLLDVLPTVLDLVDLPSPEVMQGQSLAPLLSGGEGWEPRPVILDEFYWNEEAAELAGLIEVVDGRWGASLEIDPDGLHAAEGGQSTPLMLCDLWSDRYCLHSVHEEHPDLVAKYRALLEAQFEAHKALGQLFTPSPDQVALTPEQLATLRALGYIR